MTYNELLYLKFKKRVPTCELIRKFPTERSRVSEVALLEVPQAMLKKIIRGRKVFKRLMRLKRKLNDSKLLRGKKK